MASICFDRPRENQLIFERIDWDDPMRRGYFERNREFIAEVSPILNCLTEDPIQVMFTGAVDTGVSAKPQPASNGCPSLRSIPWL